MSADFKALLPGLGLLAALVVIFAVVVERLEHVPVTRYSGYRGEALYNRFFAASLTLERIGVNVKRIDRLPTRGELPPEDATLFLVASRSTYSERRIRQLLDWANGGGHLVVAVQDTGFDLNVFEDPVRAEREDPLLEELGIDVTPYPESDFDSGDATFRLPGEQKTLVVDLARRLRSVKEVPTWSVGPAVEARVLHFSRGLGGVTVVSSAAWMDNVFIGAHQHATFAHFLATYGDRSKAWVVYAADVPDIVSLTYEHGWPTLFAGAIALLLWIFSSAARFGTRHPVEETVRRSVLEHIQATAEFLWRQGASAALVSSVRSAVLRQAARTAIGWETLSPEQRRAHVQEVAGVQPKELERLFGSSAPIDAPEFTELIRTLRGIHRRL
ncbi:MAG: DUF4350 domain-containing protein [Myxococcota bacterium]